MKHKHKHGQPKPLENHVEIPLSVQRDMILENDSSYQVNVSQLNQQLRSGSVTQSTFRGIRQSLGMAALRRAGINLKQSTQMMGA